MLTLQALCKAVGCSMSTQSQSEKSFIFKASTWLMTLKIVSTLTTYTMSASSHGHFYLYAPHLLKFNVSQIEFILSTHTSIPQTVSPLQLQLLSMISPLAHSPKCQTWRYSASPLYSQCITDSSLSFILILFLSIPLLPP